ncbi:MAG TPA: hypothetical protein VHX62_02295 [Solirubrobacteraceae bacterium]|jgi:hypothetical protein|nr:hypothetical protein [Solirubrobacteraceae bacterium]
MRSLTRTLAGLVVVAAVAFGWAHYGLKKTPAPPPPLDRQASVADLKVDYPSDWRLESASPDARLALTDALTLASPQVKDGQLVIGTAHPASPGALAAGLAATLSGRPTPQVVALGDADFYRYLDVIPTGGSDRESIYALPTTIGTVTAVCSAQSPTTAFTASCERVLATVRLTTGNVLSLGVDPSYAFALNRILDQLNAVRRSAGPGLRNADPKARAAAATTLAAAHAHAAAATGHISGIGVSVANQALVSALDADAAAYRSLAQAAGAQDVAGYARAQSAIAAANRALDGAFAHLRQFGYEVH